MKSGKAKKDAPLRQCSTEGCRKKEVRGKRGKCLTHYQALRRLVKAGKTTWDELADAGECEHLTDPQGMPRTDYGREVLARLEKFRNGNGGGRHSPPRKKGRRDFGRVPAMSDSVFTDRD